ncbi:hypothetical protein CHS0354_040374 [Potamilus streckersoni]|uniref:Fucosyltransferase n=1 Tax=Potamilus streckersoni TaxID=2493646 RepID=A0AAE0S185_9BIVA|nr:hypothetical protein CHS0354_040374 [Potamilus streckersoni]
MAFGSITKSAVTRRLLIILVIVEIIFIIIGLMAIEVSHTESFRFHDSFVQTFPHREWRNKTRKQILAWTSFWFTDYWCDMSIKGEPGRCNDRCELTRDKSRVAESDAVVFHFPDVLPWSTLPPRTPDQVWVLYNLEPPPRQIWYTGGTPWRNIYNWTMSYRKDSTIFVRPYHGYEPLSEEEKIKVKQENKNFAEGRYKIAIATVSDCYDDARRYKYTHQLMKYIDIDIYGSCGNKECPQWKPECENIHKKYKFQLAFENAYCKDYITEKYWEAHMRKIIPVVNWKTDPKGLVFPNSYINIWDFPDMKSVAEYMQKVANNDTLYNSYFDWTKEFKMNCHCGCHWCVLCDALFNTTIPAQVVIDPMQWAVSMDTCKMWSVATFLWRIVERLLFDIGLA